MEAGENTLSNEKSPSPPPGPNTNHSPRSTSPSKVKAGLKVPPRWAGAVQVDMTGMDVEVPLLFAGTEKTDDGAVSLLNMHLYEGAKLSSPRSIEACLRLGILPEELREKSVEGYIADATRNGVKRLAPTDLECVRQRHQHDEARRKTKLDTVLAERESIIDGAMQFSLTATTQNRRASTLFAMEEHKLKKLVDANQAMLRQRLLHEQKVQSIREQREKALEEERRRDEHKKQAHREEAARKEMESTVRQKLGAAKKLIEKRQQQETLLSKQRMHEEKEELRQKQVSEKKKAVEEQNKARAYLNEERQKQIQQQNKMLQEERRQELLSRIERTEEIKHQQDKQRLDHVSQRKQQAAAKQAKIKAALERSAVVREQKVAKALEKEAKANEALEEFEQTRAKLVLEKRYQDVEKERRRKVVYHEALRLIDERKTQIVAKKQSQEKHHSVLQKKKADDMKLRTNVVQLKQKDRQDNVARMKKVVEFKKYLTVEKIEQKNKKVEEIELEKARLKEKRGRHRAAIEASRVPLQVYSPGPGDYVGIDSPGGAHGSPQWKFGLSSSNLAMRVITPDGTIAKGSAPGYDPSPGPCAYQSGSLDMSSARRRAPAYAVSKAPRFHENFVGPEDMRS